MQVQTYECEETAEETVEMTAEAIALIEKLGLEGQQALIGADEESGEKQRVPYREMNGEELFVFRTLCPHRQKLQDYKQSPIPIRVLQVASYATELNFFDRLVVWDTESQTVPDPVLIGETGSEWSATRYLLARWGEHLDEWPAMIAAAARKQRQVIKAKLLEIRQKVIARLATIDDEPDAELVAARAVPAYHD